MLLFCRSVVPWFDEPTYSNNLQHWCYIILFIIYYFCNIDFKSYNIGHIIFRDFVMHTALCAITSQIAWHCICEYVIIDILSISHSNHAMCVWHCSAGLLFPGFMYLHTRCLQAVCVKFPADLADVVFHCCAGLLFPGFMYLHTLFLTRGRLESTWTVLKLFGERRNLGHSNTSVWVALKPQP